MRSWTAVTERPHLCVWHQSDYWETAKRQSSQKIVWISLHKTYTNYAQKWKPFISSVKKFTTV